MLLRKSSATWFKGLEFWLFTTVAGMWPLKVIPWSPLKRKFQARCKIFLAWPDLKNAGPQTLFYDNHAGIYIDIFKDRFRI